VSVLGPETLRAGDELAAQRRADRLRRERLLALAQSAAFTVALDLDAADALLRGRPVPRHRLDARIAAALGVPAGGTLTLDLDVIEAVTLLGPAPARCPCCGRRSA
jgi:hypothetical protein